MKAQLFLCASVLCALNEPVALSAPSQICRDGLCEVFSVSSLGRVGGGDGIGGRSATNGNISIPNIDDQPHIVQLNCRVSAEVPDAAWAGVRAMFESVRGLSPTGAAGSTVSATLNSAQQVILLFYSSIQEMIREFSCKSEAAEWK